MHVSEHKIDSHRLPLHSEQQRVLNQVTAGAQGVNTMHTINWELSSPVPSPSPHTRTVTPTKRRHLFGKCGPWIHQSFINCRYIRKNLHLFAQVATILVTISLKKEYWFNLILSLGKEHNLKMPCY